MALICTACSDDQTSRDTRLDATTAPAPAEPTSAEPALPEPPTSPAAEPEPAPPVEPSTPAAATDRAPQRFEVLGVVTQWSPMILFVQPGDTVVFKQMTGHDTETIEGMVPEGGKTWKSALGEEGYSVTLDTPGAYVYKCNPHVSTGMIGAIVVGDRPPANLEQIRASPLNKGMIGRAVRKLGEALEAP